MNKARFRTYAGLIILGVLFSTSGFGQIPVTRLPSVVDSIRKTVLDSLGLTNEDTVLRIRNLNPYMTLHVDSTMNYNLEINKNPTHYFWYLRNSPLGLKINKDNGLLSFKADKSYFLSGRLKYDYPYKVTVGVQNLRDPSERVDTSFTILFFTTEIIPSRVKPTVNSTLYIDEGDTVNFRIECEDGSFPV